MQGPSRLKASSKLQMLRGGGGGASENADLVLCLCLSPHTGCVSVCALGWKVGGAEWKFRTRRKSQLGKCPFKEFHPELDTFSSFIKPISFSAKVIWGQTSLTSFLSSYPYLQRKSLCSSCFPLPAQVLVCTLFIRWARGQEAAPGRLPFLMP